jgi:hypothetical protein
VVDYFRSARGSRVGDTISPATLCRSADPVAVAVAVDVHDNDNDNDNVNVSSSLLLRV